MLLQIFGPLGLLYEYGDVRSIQFIGAQGSAGVLDGHAVFVDIIRSRDDITACTISRPNETIQLQLADSIISMQKNNTVSIFADKIMIITS